MEDIKILSLESNIVFFSQFIESRKFLFLKEAGDPNDMALLNLLERRMEILNRWIFPFRFQTLLRLQSSDYWATVSVARLKL